MSVGQGVVSLTNPLNPVSATPAAFAMGPNGDQYVSELHGRYTAQARLGNLYTSYVTGAATSVPALATIGNMVWNPPGSGVLLSITKWTSQLITGAIATGTGVALCLGYQTTTPTTTTGATTVGGTLVNGITRPQGRAIAYSVATVLVIPVVVWVLHHNTAAINTVGMEMISGDLEGSIVIPEGGFITFAMLTGSANSTHTSSIMWEECAVHN